MSYARTGDYDSNLHRVIWTPKFLKQCFEKAGLINIASKGFAGDAGSSYVEMEKQKELARRRQEEEGKSKEGGGNKQSIQQSITSKKSHKNKE